ncbi:Complex 1 LYR protein [Trypanosoma melophagium]|uniref:Complex 1 LYR protein n=1 Tax=Trypanosoma melophagium TaxID=715481 RepID=UPI00351AA9A6|nr:Complex 1 LYR protein [Trypanosoma melophagium]
MVISSGAKETFLRHNPYRSEVISWYRKFLKVAFSVPWETDDDALYVLEETRRLFQQNKNITDVNVIQRKLREAEMRYEIGVHYRIPYPRPYHKMQGALQESGVAYAAELDSMYDHPVSPRTGRIMEGSANHGTMGGVEYSMHLIDEGINIEEEKLPKKL